MTATILLIIGRASLLLVAAWLFTMLLRKSSAAARHLVWTLAIGGSLVVPIASLALPRWELPLLPAAAPLPAVERQPANAATATLGDTSRDATSAEDTALPVASSIRDHRANPVSAGPPESAARQSVFPARVTTFGVLLLVWGLGVALVLARLALGTMRMRWIARHARQVSGGRWQQMAERLADALGVRHRVIFLEGAATAMPMTWGVLKPRVLLPGAADAWPLARQRVVLLHELAHVKRYDCLTQLLAQATCAMYWFNPLAWMAAARLRAEREHACDDVVLAAGTRGSDYADHLLDIASTMRGAALPTWAAVAMAHRSQLEGRLMAILDPGIPRQYPTRRRSLALAATLALLALPIAVVTPVPQAAEIASIDPPPMQASARPAPDPTPAPAPAPRPAASGVQDSRFAGPLAEAMRDALPDAVADLRAEGWLGPIARSTVHAVGRATGQAAVGGVAGGVSGGIRGGIAGGIGQEVEVEREKEEQRAARNPRVVAALVEALKDSDKEVREQAMSALASMRAPEALAAIRGSLKDENPSVREQAAFALGQYRDRESTDALAAALKDSSADVREQAVFALGQIRDARVSEPIAQALKDADADVREQAAFALGQLRNSASVDALAAALKDASADVREQAAFALGQIRDRRAVDPLVAALHDQSADVREQAAFALGQLRDPRAVDGLTAALKDANVEVRRQAAFALGQIGR